MITFAIPGISIGGHLGGLAAGSATGWLFLEYRRRGLAPLLPMALSAALGVTLFVASLWAASLWANPLF